MTSLFQKNENNFVLPVSLTHFDLLKNANHKSAIMDERNSQR